MIEDAIWEKINSSLYDFLLVYDFDKLLFNFNVISKIFDEGYEVFIYKDIEEYRIFYETKIRDMNKKVVLIVTEKVYLPWDVKQDYHEVWIRLKDLFFNLDVDVIKQIDVEYFDVIYQKMKSLNRVLNYEETCNFILRYIYNIDISVINNLQDLIKQLLRLYFKGTELPQVLSDFIKNKLVFLPPEVSCILNSKGEFFKFFQTEFDKFVGKDKYDKMDGEDYIDFLDPEIRVYLDDLIMDNIIKLTKPTELNNSLPIKQLGLVFNLKSQEEEYKHLRNRLKKLLCEIKNYKDWFEVAEIFGRIINLCCILNDDEYETLSHEINVKFKDWLFKNYGKLPYLSYSNGPIMVHHIQPYIINLLKKENKNKVAFILVDGMSEFNWTIIKEYLENMDLRIEKKSCFAWIPTITSISRQSIFSAEPPLRFKTTMFSTNYDEKHFKRFFMNSGYKEKEIAYIRSIKTFEEENLRRALEEDCKVLCVVVDVIDEFVHGQIFNYKGLQNQINFYMSEGYLQKFLEELFKENYEVFIASDHGNVLTVGQGNVKEGVYIDTLSNRVKIYPKDIPIESPTGIKIIKWGGIGLPDEYNYVVSDDNLSFHDKGKTILTHGGISIEEIIVPFVRIMPSL
ncbi:PglZ domain protein [Caldicellulosiruptor acetigenus I77R1B]|uniref:PglZ domain protein n=1 Tax=Caldicellulosiruptor acetigenus (strain ATCC 700853 / DSM 12137 / I77R1B) TaxID=632335 RepID=E4SA92_CALA7|nr:BREX-3 system phosphatase PglZ [Caldicellulosiruptor acetigenus]ADQ40169.1 PglZ domain protein [Caldicellulosiruptor acetigenus I77R1B]